MRFVPEVALGIKHQLQKRYASRNEKIIAELRDLANASAPQTPEMIVKKKAAEIAAAMALLHGGEWQVQVDHDLRFVLVAPQPARL